MFPVRRDLVGRCGSFSMPITRFLVVTLSTGLTAWAGWSVGRPFGILPGFLIANLGCATGWYFGRTFVRNNLD
jgi:hypothetical protein